MPKRYWIYIALTLIWVTQPLTTLRQHDWQHVVGALVDGLFTAFVAIAIIDIAYKFATRKVTVKNKNENQ